MSEVMTEEEFESLADGSWKYEIASLREQLENCKILMVRIENERNALVEENQRLARAWEAMRREKEKAKANEKEMFDAALKTDQEPVATFAGRRDTPEGTKEFWGYMWNTETVLAKGTKLYLHPARTLSDEEIELIWNMTEFHGGDDWKAALEFARAVLKEASK